MAKNFSENSIPQIGIVTPSKELPITTIYKDSGLSPLEYFIRNFTPDWPGAFAAVYHHTVLRAERQKDSEPIHRKGESRYINQTPFPDPFTLLSLLATSTTHTELYTAVLVSPQMQTGELAQKVAAIANLSRGRFNLGVGVGWNKNEYEALGRGDIYPVRGKFLNEQIPALRKILTGETFTGQIGPWEKFDQMAINPGSTDRVPIWIGGQSEAARKRAALIGDGWMPLGDVDQFSDQIGLLHEFLLAEGKDPNRFKTMGRIALGKTASNQWVDTFLQWQQAGATHVVLSTTGDENEYDPHGEKTDPYYHLRMINKFLKITGWLRTPAGSFSSLFAEQNTYQFLNLPKDYENFMNLQLDKDLKIEHVFQFLLSRGFTETHINNFKVTSKNGEQILVSQPKGLIGQNGEKVIVMNQENHLNKTFLFYDSRVELGFGNWNSH
ncbi:MAG: TIGR03619 family F420-dependent LLM class oxidoreductase [Candidatus Pacebacteria bacterium]|nr:TIGR03619 family F420-dependent LLM class oxidoreductase [Candidatus Paceibacterota bacterium]